MDRGPWPATVQRFQRVGYDSSDLACSHWTFAVAVSFTWNTPPPGICKAHSLFSFKCLFRHQSLRSTLTTNLKLHFPYPAYFFYSNYCVYSIHGLSLPRIYAQWEKGVFFFFFDLFLFILVTSGPWGLLGSKKYSGVSGSSMVKNLPANAGDVSLIPGSGQSSGGGNSNPLQYSCLGNPMDRGA